MMKSILAFAALTHFAGAAFAGACAQPSVTATVLTPNGTTIDQDGGVVVGLQPGYGGKNESDLGKLNWKFVEGGKPTEPKLTLLAPGLAVLVPAKRVEQLALQSDQDVKVTVKFRFAPRKDMPMAAAPNVKGIKETNYPSPRGSSTSTDVTLGAAPPADTIAVLVFDVTNLKSAKNWAKVDPKRMAIQIGHTGRCQTVLAGTHPSPIGDTVVLVWVDAQGHTSEPSKAIEIK